MIKAVCGLDASAHFDEHFSKVGVNLSDNFGSIGLVMTESAAFQSKLSGIMMLEKQMADDILVGPSKVLDTTLAAMGKVHSWGRKRKFLGKLVVKTDLGFQVKPFEKLFGSLMSSAGTLVHSPGVI